MTIQQLIDILEAAKNKLGPDAPVDILAADFNLGDNDLFRLDSAKVNSNHNGVELASTGNLC